MFTPSFSDLLRKLKSAHETNGPARETNGPAKLLMFSRARGKLETLPVPATVELYRPPLYVSWLSIYRITIHVHVLKHLAGGVISLLHSK